MVEILTVIGDVERPFEAEFPEETPIGDVLKMHTDVRDIKAVQIGGMVQPFLIRDALDMPLSRIKGAGNSGDAVDADVLWVPVIRVVRESTGVVELEASIMDFLCGESCGKCVFCREGTLHLRNMLDALIVGRSYDVDLDLMAEIGRLMQLHSICALGRAAANPVLSSLTLFHDEYDRFKRATPGTPGTSEPHSDLWGDSPDLLAMWRGAVDAAKTAGSDAIEARFAATQSDPLASPDHAAITGPAESTGHKATPDSGEKITVIIDGRVVEAESGKTILDVCLDAGVYIPHLCSHNALHPIGACRLCVVEITGMDGLQPSCITAAYDGMSVRTDSEAINETRRMSIELMLSGHQADCGTCIKYLNCELQSLKQFLVGDDLRVSRRSRLFGVTESDPIFTREPNKCVLCGRCIRACRELRGVGALDYKRSHGEAYIGVGPDADNDCALADAGCRFCGACAEVCPTGAILDRDEFGQNKSRKEALLPCKNTCPAEIDVPRYIRHIREGSLAAAVAVIREKVPFPHVLGYVCSHPCEVVCRRGQVNEPLSICRLKRYAADNCGKLSPPQSTGVANRDIIAQSRTTGIQIKQETGMRAAVIGAGPAGLTAAYYLALQGHSVTVFEAMPEAGGMLRYGIPAYRLPPGILETEIAEILETGVAIRTNEKIESIDPLLANGFDAVLIAIGAHEGVRLRIPGANGADVYTSVEFLRASRMNEPIKLNGRVMVLGGGNVAFDCARTALRLGASEVMLACLESREMMPAGADEIAAGEDEGIRILPSRSFRRIKREDGRVAGVGFINVTSLTFNDENMPIAETDEDSEHFVEADAVIFAVGQRPEIPDDFGVDKTDRGFVEASTSNMAIAGWEGVFAASDAVTGTDKVISAIAAGRKAAQSIDKYLGGRGRFDQKKAQGADPPAKLDVIEGFSTLKRTPENFEPAQERVCDFRLVERGLRKDEAIREAGRCLQCDLRLNMKPEKFWSSY